MRIDELDADGHLGTPTRPIDAAWSTLVDDCADEVLRAAPEVHSLYVYGSVARGTAERGRSDLDLLAALRSPAAGDGIARAAERLTARHRTTVAEVTVATVAPEQLAADGIDGWADRAFLRHGCVHVRGPDLRLTLERVRPSARLAWAFNHRTGELLAAVRADATAAATDMSDGADISALVRRASRRSLLGLTSVASARSGTWTTHRPVAVAWLARREPALGALATDALHWCREPVDDPAALAAVLDVLGAWVVHELDAIGRDPTV